MNEKTIVLDQFTPRDYQINICRAFEQKDKTEIRKFVVVWPRRAGKDICAFNLCIRECMRKIGTIFYVFPTFSQGRRILWDAIQNDGMRILDYIPKELVESRNEQQMRVRFKNGSVFQIIGSDNYDNTLVGTNPMGVVFSEYALTDPRAYQFVKPILAANDGWVMFISTPRGKNSLFDLYNVASKSKDWFCEKLTVEDTRHISVDLIEKEIEEGTMSEELAQQEYWCSWTMGVEGAYYTKYIDNLRINAQIGTVPWQMNYPVHTAWDIGVRDFTSIIFFQTISDAIKVIDYYENSKEGLEHYVSLLDSKPYKYGTHIAPHDIAVKEWGSGITRIEKARQLGVSFTLADNVSIHDGIEAVRSTLNRMWIDEQRCSKLIKALENYRQEYDSKKKVYKPYPLHNWSSHAADACRYMCVSLPKTRDGMSEKDVERIRNEALYGSNKTGHPLFDDHNNNHFFYR